MSDPQRQMIVVVLLVIVVALTAIGFIRNGFPGFFPKQTRPVDNVIDSKQTYEAVVRQQTQEKISALANDILIGGEWFVTTSAVKLRSQPSRRASELKTLSRG